jgi:tRNA(adenine34) deaminase
VPAASERVFRVDSSRILGGWGRPCRDVLTGGSWLADPYENFASVGPLHGQARRFEGVDFAASKSMVRAASSAPIAQLDRALVYGTSCRKFESSWARWETLVEADEEWMRVALGEADAAAEEGEVPVGCVIRGADGAELARGHNLREQLQDATAHAEVVAIQKASKRLGTWRLVGATAFVTLEPCVMCAGALVLARVERVVYGCDDPKGGGVRTLYNVGQDPRLNHRFELRAGVLADEAVARLQAFFGRLRQAGKK